MSRVVEYSVEAMTTENMIMIRRGTVTGSIGLSSSGIA
jgi:hypothetical protein